MLPCHLKCKSSCLTAEAETTLITNEFNYFSLVFHKDNLNIKHKYIGNILYIHIHLNFPVPVNSSWKIYRLHLLENFRPTVANQSELEVCLYFFPIDKHV